MFEEKNKHVSSANKRGVYEIALMKSLMDNMNNNGPKIEPRGTPNVISKLVDLIPEEDTNCVLSVTNEVGQYATADSKRKQAN